MKLPSLTDLTKLFPLKYLRKRSQERLYRQWVERAGLPPESVPTEEEPPESPPPPTEYAEPTEQLEYGATPHYGRDGRVVTHPDVTGDVIQEIRQQQRRLFLLYVLLGAATVIFLVSLILILVYSC